LVVSSHVPQISPMKKKQKKHLELVKRHLDKFWKCRYRMALPMSLQWIINPQSLCNQWFYRAGMQISFQDTILKIHVDLLSWKTSIFIISKKIHLRGEQHIILQPPGSRWQSKPLYYHKLLISHLKKKPKRKCRVIIATKDQKRAS
jgi:hypothetical protein